jgi:hypothetical protein
MRSHGWMVAPGVDFKPMIAPRMGKYVDKTIKSDYRYIVSTK